MSSKRLFYSNNLQGGPIDQNVPGNPAERITEDSQGRVTEDVNLRIVES